MHRLEYETKTNYRHSSSVLWPWRQALDSKWRLGWIRFRNKNCIPVSRVSLAWMYWKAFARKNDTYEKHIRTHLKEKLKFVALELILLLYRTREPLLIEAWMPWKRSLSWGKKSVKVSTPLFSVLKHPVLEEFKKKCCPPHDLTLERGHSRSYFCVSWLYVG